MVVWIQGSLLNFACSEIFFATSNGGDKGEVWCRRDLEIEKPIGSLLEGKAGTRGMMPVKSIVRFAIMCDMESFLCLQ